MFATLANIRKSIFRAMFLITLEISFVNHWKSRLLGIYNTNNNHPQRHIFRNIIVGNFVSNMSTRINHGHFHYRLLRLEINRTQLFGAFFVRRLNDNKITTFVKGVFTGLKSLRLL